MTRSAALTPEEFKATQGLSKAAAAAAHARIIRLAIMSAEELKRAGKAHLPCRQPVSVASVVAYGIPMPASYSQEGDFFVWRPASRKNAG